VLLCSGLHQRNHPDDRRGDCLLSGNCSHIRITDKYFSELLTNTFSYYSD
jgi:hypothetical protein